MNPELHNINIELVLDLIPRLLQVKMRKLNLRTLGDITNYSEEDFRKLYSTGNKSAEVFNFLKRRLVDEPESFIELADKNMGHAPIQLSDELHNIRIALVSELIPGILQSKIDKLNLLTLGDIHECPVVMLRKLQGTGEKSVRLFTDLKERLISEPDVFLTLAERKTGFVQLPVNHKNISNQSPIELLSDLVMDFLNLLENPLRKEFILLGYGIGSRMHTRDEIANLFLLNRERIRQVQVTIIERLGTLLKGNRIEEPRSELRPEAKEALTKLIDLLYSKSIHSIHSLKTLLSVELNEQLIDETEGMLNLLIDAIGIIECGVRENYFTKSKLYVTDKEIKDELLTIAQIVKEILMESVISMTEPDILIKVRNKVKKAQAKHISDALSALLEIESIETDESIKYQIKFDMLGNARDLTYRILFEKNEVMMLDQIVSAINGRLASDFNNNLYDRNSLALSTDPRFRPLGRNGFWGLTSWSLNRGSIETLVKKSMHKLDKPSTQAEVVAEILKVRPDIKTKSINATIGRICHRVDQNKFILPVWIDRFPNLSIEKKKKRIHTHTPNHHILLRNKIISIIINCGQNKIRSNEIIRRMTSTDPKVKKPTLYKLMADERFFTKVRGENDKVFIGLNPRLENEHLK
jgi:hypothetical protein